MSTNQTFESLERDAYRASYSDGIIDIFVGISLLWIGVAWIWLQDLAGVAGVLPAVFVTPVLAGRKRFAEARAGYVRWNDTRRRWEHRNLVAVFDAGVLMLALGVGAFFAASGSGTTSVMDAIGPGLLAFLLALMAVGLAFMMDAARMLIYAAVLVIAGVIAAATDANSGWPLLTSGCVVAIVGVVMFTRFLRANPVGADQ